MSKVSFITGTVGSLYLKGISNPREVPTHWGCAQVYLKDNAYFILRHGKKRNIPPHIINHKANITALKDLGVKAVVGLYSVGSLNMAFGPGTIIIPQDYINFGNVQSLFEDECIHITPRLTTSLREKVTEALRDMGISLKARGVYIQTTGSRLETKAEISMYRPLGDIIGMTMANEATLAQEAGLPFCPICFVDNYCNGVVSTILTMETIKKETVSKASLVNEIIAVLRDIEV